MSNPERVENPISATIDLRALRVSGNPEQRSIAEIAETISKIASDVSAVRHDVNVLDRFRIWEKLEEKFDSIDTTNIEGSNDLDDIASKIDNLESKLEDIENKIG